MHLIIYTYFYFFNHKHKKCVIFRLSETNSVLNNFQKNEGSCFH